MRPEPEINSIKKKPEKIISTTEGQLEKTTIAPSQRSTAENFEKREDDPNSDPKWPSFDRIRNSVQFVNSNNISVENKTVEIMVQKNQDNYENANQSTTYPKNFAYHRVTGKIFSWVFFEIQNVSFKQKFWIFTLLFFH